MDHQGRIVRLVLAVLVSILVAGAAGALAGAILLRLAPEDLGVGLVVVAVFLMTLSGAVGWVVWRLMSTWVDWRRIQAEQRLWESGPLGREWLRVRQRLAGDRPPPRAPEDDPSSPDRTL
jgi:hypothetical protein